MPPLEGQPVDMLFALYVALGVLAVRLASERLLLPALNSAFKARLQGEDSNPSKIRKRAYNCFNNSFIAASSLLMTSWAWHVTMTDNGGCTPFSTHSCLAGWPAISVSRQFKLVWLTVFGFYLYEMICTALRVGCVLSTEMVVHHIITMWMMLYGYFYSLGRYGLMATALLDTSNTLLHSAKALNYAEAAFPGLASLKDAAFKSFALSFLLCRVLAPPLALIKPGLLDGRAMPLLSYYITNGLLLFIYSLQLFWFVKIVKIAMGGPAGDEEEESSKPAKVAAAAAAGTNGAALKAE
ncbi:hypothetical protein OEZ86_014418 [Tetradesmus obliquus]|nr:hypothetical protein OEZ86_014418 [Tetradesmus obliquus]